MWLALALLACSGDDTTTDTTPTVDTALPFVEDVFLQTVHPKVDILWAVDAAWDGELDDMVVTSAMETLLLAGTDFRMGVLDTTETTNEKGLILKKWEAWPVPAGAFSLGTAGGPPLVRESIYTALELRKDVGLNREFRRTDAHLYLLVFTEVDDGSDDDPIGRRDFLDWARALNSDSVRLGAITTADASTSWSNLAEDLGDPGVIFEAGSFRKGVDTLMRDAIGQKVQFTLSQVPTDPPEELVVSVREQETVYEIEADYAYDPTANTVTFNKYVPPPGAEIRVRYLVDEPVEPTTPEETGATSTAAR